MVAVHLGHTLWAQKEEEEEEERCRCCLSYVTSTMRFDSKFPGLGLYDNFRLSLGTGQ